MADQGFPHLEPGFICKLYVRAEDMCPIGDIYTGSSCVYIPTTTGTIKTVDGFEPKLDAQVVNGGDFLYFDPDKKKARLNVKAVAKSQEGTMLTFGYTGCVHINDEVAEIFAGRPTRTIPFGQSTTGHFFETGDPKYKEFENVMWSGNGRFVLENGQLAVESRVSKVVPSTENP